MKVSISSWDKWAPAAYLLVIGLAAGYGVGLAIGSSGTGASDSAYFILLPIAMVSAAFVALIIVSKRFRK